MSTLERGLESSSVMMYKSHVLCTKVSSEKKVDLISKCLSNTKRLEHFNIFKYKNEKIVINAIY